jgi:SAM-dependent methyltransferase
VSERAHRGAPAPRSEGLSPRRAASVYDRIGWLQDTQRVFEAPALARLIADGRLAEARRVVEVGCGTGRFARELLTNVCGSTVPLRRARREPADVPDRHREAVEVVYSGLRHARRRYPSAALARGRR